MLYNKTELRILKSTKISKYKIFKITNFYSFNGLFIYPPRVFLATCYNLQVVLWSKQYKRYVFIRLYIEAMSPWKSLALSSHAKWIVWLRIEWEVKIRSLADFVSFIHSEPLSLCHSLRVKLIQNFIISLKCLTASIEFFLQFTCTKWLFLTVNLFDFVLKI